MKTWEEGCGGIFTLGNHPLIVSCCVITLLYSVLAKEIQLQHKAPVLDIEVFFSELYTTLHSLDYLYIALELPESHFSVAFFQNRIIWIKPT